MWFDRLLWKCPDSLGLPTSMILFSQGLQKCSSSSFLAPHLAPILPFDYLKLWPSQVSDLLPVHMFILPPCEPGVLCTPGQCGLDGNMHANECMFHCLNSKKQYIFSPLVQSYLPFGLCDLLRMHGGVLAVIFLLCIRVPVPANHCQSPFCLYNPKKSLELQDPVSMLFPWDPIAFGEGLAVLWLLGFF